LARALTRFNVEIVSTGGTAKTLRDASVNVRDISDITGFPEMMDGRVKTLHPRVHGGLLAIRDNEEHVAALQQHGIEPIDMVVVNLYPFAETIKRVGVTREEAIEQIDIGGPAMIRSAAKNSQDVAVVVSPNQYGEIIDELKRQNKAVVCISHDIEFVFEHSDVIAVMRLGRVVATRPAAGTPREEIIGLITGAIAGDAPTENEGAV